MRRQIRCLWGAVFCFVLAGISAIPLVAQSDGAITDARVAPNAAIQPFKFDISYASDAAYVTARTAAYKGVAKAVPGLVEGEFYYRTSDNVIRYYDGAAWATYSPAPGAGLTLDDVYTAGQTIGRDLGTIAVTDAKADASTTMSIARSAGTGVLLSLTRSAGSGTDLSSNNWSVSSAGILTGKGLILRNDDTITLGTGHTLEYDTAVGTAGFRFGAAANTPVYLGLDAAGLDFVIYSDAAGDYAAWDASNKRWSFIDTDLFLDDDAIAYFGDSDDFSLQYNGSDLVLDGAVSGDGIIIGTAGEGHDVTIYGDTGSAIFDYGYAAALDELRFDDYRIHMGDSDAVAFGDGTGASPNDQDFSVYYDPALGSLVFDNLTAGDSVSMGVAGDGADFYLYDNTGGVVSVKWIAADEDLDFNNANAHLIDTSMLKFGSSEDVRIAYNGGTNLLEVTQGVAGTGDIVVYAATAGDFWRFNTAAESFIFDDVNMTMTAGESVYLGATNTATPADGVVLLAGTGSLDIDSVAAAGADVTFGSNQATDVAFWSTNGIGAPAEMVRWDYATDTLKFLQGGTSTAQARFDDEAELAFGNVAGVADVLAYWDTAAAALPGGEADYLHIYGATGPAVAWGTDGTGTDHVFFSDTVGDWLYWDEDAGTMKTQDVAIWLGDGDSAPGAVDDAIFFGDDTHTTPDMRLYYHGGDSQLRLTPEVDGASTVVFGDASSGKYFDMTWYGQGAEYIAWDGDVGGSIVKIEGVDHYIDSNSMFRFGGTGPGFANPGFSISGAAGTLYMADPLGAGELSIGQIAGAGYDTDVMFWGGNGGGAAQAEITWDYGDDTLDFNANARLVMNDSTEVCYGNGGGGAADQDVCQTFDGTELALDTANAAGVNYRIGDSGADETNVTVEIGDETDAAIKFNTRSTGSAHAMIERAGTAMTVERIFLPAAEWLQGATATITAHDDFYGYAMVNGLGDVLQTMWNPPKWVDDTAAITAYPILSCDAAGDTEWTLNYTTVTLGTTPTATAGTDITPITIPVAAGSVDKILDTSGVAATIPETAVITSAFRPIRLTFTRETDTNAGDCFFYGMELEVTRKYVD